MGQRAAASGCFQPALQDFSSLPGSSCREGGIPTVFRRFHPRKAAPRRSGAGLSFRQETESRVRRTSSLTFEIPAAAWR